MPWTESRSRDEWLAEVRRRGERIRRRRQLAVSAVGAVALLVPGAAVVSLSSSGGSDRQLQVAVGGPGTTATPGTGIASVIGGDEAGPTTTVLAAAAAESLPAAPPLLSTTTTEVHRRTSAVNGVPVAEDPVVRPSPPTTARTGANAAASGSAAGAAPSTTVASTDPPLAACPTADVKVTVALDKGTYAPGERVGWSSTLENRSGTTCLVSGRAFFRVENSAGTTVGSFAYTANYMLPVKAEPGKTITNTGSWDQQDCSGPACVQVPVGTYVVVAEWTEGGSYVGRGAFRISG